MKERPILFSGPMVRAILAGRKTQTRRVVKVPSGRGRRSLPWDPYYADCDGRLKFEDLYGEWHDFEKDGPCPYGRAGDRLWVRETWCNDGQGVWSIGDAESAHACGLGMNIYRADGGREGCKWFPSIHMPRWASRIILEVTDVRVERLHTISEEDADAEGVDPVLVPPDGGGSPHVEGFRVLWDSIAKPGAKWEDDPWVWVVSFQRLGG